MVRISTLGVGAALIACLAIGHFARAADDGPALPDASPIVGPIHRSPSGTIEPVTPESLRAEGIALCDAKALCVGKGEHYATLAAALAAAKPGATIDVIGGEYREAATIAVPHLTIRGTAGRPLFSCGGVAHDSDNACFAVAADNVTLDNIEITGARSAKDPDNAAACIRSDGEVNLTLNEIYCHGAQNGILATGGSTSIVHSEFFDNGGGPEGENAAFGAECVSVKVSGSVFRDTHDGDEFVSRCQTTDISDSTFRSTMGRRAIDFPAGGNAMIYRSTIEKTQGATDKDVIAFSDQSCDHPGTLQLKQVSLVNSRDDAEIRNYNRCSSGAITFEQVTTTGMAVATVGYTVDQGGNNLAAAPQGMVGNPLNPRLEGTGSTGPVEAHGER